MAWIDTPEEVFQHLKTEEVPAVRIAPGDVIIDGPDVMVVTRVINNGGRLSFQGGEDGGIIQQRVVRRVVRSCLSSPPIATSWDTFEDKRVAIENMRVRVDEVRSTPDALRDRFNGAHEVRKLQDQPDGYCSRCCLPVGDKHVAHLRQGDTELTSFIQIKRQQYTAGLKKLTDEEIMAMPIPSSPIYFYTLNDELRDRIRDDPPPRSRYERLMADV